MTPTPKLRRDITLSFGRLTIKSIDSNQVLGGEALREVLVNSLDYHPPISTRVETDRKGPVRAFLQPDGGKFDFAPGLVGGTVILGEGETYVAVDRTTGSKIRGTYNQPPLRGSTLFVADLEGWVTLEKKETPYITPDAVLELLAVRIRASAGESTFLSVSASMMSLHDEVEEVISFINDLDSLTRLELSGLRAPNPHEQSDVLERARLARIRRLVQETDDPAGIDRESEIVVGELKHAQKKYARITGVEGKRAGNYAGLQIRNDSTELGVHVEGDSEKELLMRMHDHLKRLKGKLRRSGREPL